MHPGEWRRIKERFLGLVLDAFADEAVKVSGMESARFAHETRAFARALGSVSWSLIDANRQRARVEAALEETQSARDVAEDVTDFLTALLGAAAIPLWVVGVLPALLAATGTGAVLGAIGAYRLRLRDVEHCLVELLDRVAA